MNKKKKKEKIESNSERRWQLTGSSITEKIEIEKKDENGSEKI